MITKFKIIQDIIPNIIPKQKTPLNIKMILNIKEANRNNKDIINGILIQKIKALINTITIVHKVLKIV